VARDVLVLEWRRAADAGVASEGASPADVAAPDNLPGVDGASVVVHSSASAADAAAAASPAGTPLDACFDRFRTREQLGADDAWFCPNCKDHVQAFKKLDLYALPDTLVVHLKRFVHEVSKYGARTIREKITELVSFPLEGLDLSDYVVGPEKDSAVFDCVGVSRHHGTLTGGHYTAHVRSAADGEWYLMDDSRVSKVDAANLERETVEASAYVLFFKKRGTSVNHPSLGAWNRLGEP